LLPLQLLRCTSSLRELKEHAGTLTAKLTPSIARTILNDLYAFGLEPSLSLLERWIVVDNIVADLIAVDSINDSTGGVRTFRYEPSELDRITLSNPELSRVQEEAFVDHIKRRVLDDDLALAPFRDVTSALSLSFTSDSTQHIREVHERP